MLLDQKYIFQNHWRNYEDSDGLVQERRNSIANTLKLHFSWLAHPYDD